ncbi:MAG: FAD-dependent oxidoreductase [Notoacmeibacter sp.]|nr:FAD-dependent oxidoreductase [Notoacmeibacter sp.]
MEAANRQCDVLVLGSGAGGLATAVAAAHFGLSVIVAEKAPVFGGTTAWSGGWLWIPRNPLAVAAGIVEDPREPLRYLESELGNRVRDPRIPVFLDNGPEMVSFFADHAAMEWIDGNRIPDFHESEGRAHGGRSVSVAPYDGRRLGPLIGRLRPPLDVVSLAGMGIASGADMAHFFNATRSLGSLLHVAGRLARHARDLVLRRRAMQLVNGNALVARLLKAAHDKGVVLLDSAPLTRLVHEENRVTGAVLATAGGEITVTARRGVVLATGGFPHDRARIAQNFDHDPQGTRHQSAAPDTNTGDGIHAGEQAGGIFETGFSHAGAWAPVSLVPKRDGATGRFPHLVERAKPGFIAVLPDGRRFVNEADSYHDFMKALFVATPAGHEPVCWLIASHRAQRRFGLGWSKPFPFPAASYEASGYLKSAGSLAGLARACGIDPQGLEETVRRFNAHARVGQDPDFGRGGSAYNRIQGDPSHGPNPSLGALDTAPFHAVKIVPGSLGTFAGLRTDARARVLDAGGAAIPGLYAAGNDMASIFGGNYPSGGITIGPAMTFGYIAARTLAGLPVTGIDTPGENAALFKTMENSDEVL